MVSCIKKYGELYDGKNIIMVSHGASIKAAISILSDGKIDFKKNFLKNTCINIIEKEMNTLTVKYFNLSFKDYLNIKQEIEIMWIPKYAGTKAKKTCACIYFFLSSKNLYCYEYREVLINRNKCLFIKNN